MRYDAEGPFMLWTNHHLEGWAVQSFDSAQEMADHLLNPVFSGGEHVATKRLRIVAEDTEEITS